MSRARQAVARLMTESKRNTPHFYVTMEIDMDEAFARLQAANRSRGQRVSATALMVTALAEVLGEHPKFNSLMVDDVPTPQRDVSVGVAIATDGGLVAPALLDCRGSGLEEVNRALVDLVERARSGRVKGRELSGSTFTLSNLGMYDVTSFTAIINPPQVGILATGRIEERVVVSAGSPAVRRVMTATLSADHRAVDGAEAAIFLKSFRDLLEAPEGLL